MNAADLQYAAGWRVVRLLPERVAQAVFRMGADLAVRRDGAGVRQLRANLARLGAAHLVREGMRSYARYWCETFRLSAADGPRMVAGTVPRMIRGAALKHSATPTYISVGQMKIAARL